MPSKTEEYLALAQRTANGLTRYWESWTAYLTTASRLYKYRFEDQLMIYAQRPDATACADYDIWNNRMNRYVRRGSKGIALLDESSGYPRLHYVFDVSDTGVRRNSRDPDLWQYNDDLKQPVSDALTAAYGISHERFSQQLADIAGKLVADYWDNNSEDIRAIVDGSFLMDYDSTGLEMQFKSAAAISVTYTLLERCGFEPDGFFDKDSFQAIYDFSTPDTVYALGAAVSDISREVLRTVERAVKTTIRRRNNERSQHEHEQQSELKYHVRLLLDEFANIGLIPKFDKLIATIRSREISASIILQSQSQLKTIYKDAAETIIGNCDTMLFLGGKESSTLKEISETLGKETIDLYNTSDTRGQSPSFGTTYQKTGKELMSRDELSVMDGSKCILQLRGVRPFLSDKFDITKHKRYKELSDFDKKNAFDVERYLKHELRLRMDEEFDCYEVDVSEESTA